MSVRQCLGDGTFWPEIGPRRIRYRGWSVIPACALSLQGCPGIQRQPAKTDLCGAPGAFTLMSYIRGLRDDAVEKTLQDQ